VIAAQRRVGDNGLIETIGAEPAMNLPAPPRKAATPGRVAENIFFPLLIACGGMFCLTTLILVVCSFDTSGAPIVAFFEQYAGWMIFIEMGITILVAFLALVVDRRRTLATMASEPDSPNESPAMTGKDGH
jgi:hypothetical protein